MKIKLCDLQPNPFRRMDRNPIDRHKVESLKESINQTGFWDNVLARPHPSEKGKYQLAYGHHRIIAVQESGISEVDIPVHILDDARMIKIMGDENLLQGDVTPAILYETIHIAKEFLEDILSKYDTWDQLIAAEGTFSGLIKGTLPLDRFRQLQSQGVGREILESFFGGNWTTYRIQEALAVLNDEEINQVALEKLSTVAEAQEFRQVMKNKGIPKEEQLVIAEKVATIRSERSYAKETGVGSGGGNYRRNIREDIKTAAPEHFEDEESKLIEIQEKIEIWKQRISALRRASTDLLVLFQGYDVEEIHGYFTRFDAFYEISQMIEELKPLMSRFGYDFTKKQESGYEIFDKKNTTLQ